MSNFSSPQSKVVGQTSICWRNRYLQEKLMSSFWFSAQTKGFRLINPSVVSLWAISYRVISRPLHHIVSRFDNIRVGWELSTVVTENSFAKTAREQFSDSSSTCHDLVYASENFVGTWSMHRQWRGSCGPWNVRHSQRGCAAWVL